jgi:serine/threonine protein kinase
MAPEVFEMASRSAIAKFGKDDVDEQITGLKGYGKEVDIWALGCVAAEILRQEDGYEVRVLRSQISLKSCFSHLHISDGDFLYTATL